MFRLSTLLKNALYLLILLQVAPVLFVSIKKQYRAILEQHTKVGVVTINDALYEAQAPIQELRAFFQDKDVRAILLRINCPGGYPGAAQAFYNELRLLKQEYSKPVGVYVENICASGGYYAACAADFMVSTPSAFIGSIGVYIQQPCFKEFINEHKIGYSTIQTGAYKTAGNMFLECSEENKKMLQSLTDDTYRQFVADVVQARPQLSLKKATEWANGKVFTGSQALALGLVDAVGSPATAEALLRKKTPIAGEIEWVYSAGNKSLLKRLLGSDEANPDSGSFAKSFIQTCCSSLCTWWMLPH